MELISQKLPLFKLIQLKTASFWQSLSNAEKLYCCSLLLLIIPLGGYVLASILTLIGLTIEFWPRFADAWESLAGKAVILLFYASITNFALVSSATIVNEVTGVSATHFNYTHNFALLLILPVWMISISLAALLLFQIIMPFYLIALIMLKPFGIKLVRLLSKSEHPVLTNSIRFVASFAIISQLFILIDGEQQINQAFADVDENNSAVQTIEQKEPEIHQLSLGIQDSAADDANIINIDINGGYGGLVKSLVAMFAFRFEADTFSRCESPEGTKSVELNDYEVLQINKEKEAKYGYSFSVKRCVSPAFPANVAPN